MFITGISKFSQLSIFSEINNLKVISMQIDSQKYLVPYTLDGRRLTKIGMSFSSTERNVTEWLVE